MFYNRDLGLVVKDDDYYEYLWNPQHPEDYILLASDEFYIFALFTDKIQDFTRLLSRSIHKYIKYAANGLFYKDTRLCFWEPNSKIGLTVTLGDMFCWSDYIVYSYELGINSKYVWLLFDRRSFEFLGSMSRHVKCFNTEAFARVVLALKEIDFTH